MTKIFLKNRSPSFRTFVRILVIVCLIVTTVIVGVGTYLILSHLQNKSQQEQYYAITRKIQSSTTSVILDKQDALTTGLALALEICPNATNWPECGIPFSFYQSILNPLYRITQARSMTTAIVITPSEVSNFETFAYSFFKAQGHPELGISPFGKGIFAVNATTGKRFHDTVGVGGGKRDMLVVVMEATDLVHNTGAFMHNTYSEKKRIQAIDYVLDCVEKEKYLGNYDTSATSLNCTAITGIVFLVQDAPLIRPSALTFVPVILPNSSQIVAVMAAVHNWDTVLNYGANEEVDGVIAILSDGTTSHSYIYDNGKVVYYAQGDHHDSTYNNQRVSFSATTYGGPIQYTVDLYPTKAWMDHYLNNIPLIASLLMVGLVVLTSIVFYVYDFLMNREAVHKDLVMQTKRQYVRYISHEIRTPLNVVHLGFQVLYTEMKKMQHGLTAAENHNTKPSSASLGSSSPPISSHTPSPGKNGDNLQEEAAFHLNNPDQKGVISVATNAVEAHSKSDDSEQTRIEYFQNVSVSRSEIDTVSSSTSIVPFIGETSIEEHENGFKVSPFRSLLTDWVDLVHDIVESLNSAICVLNDLIDFDKIDTGTMALQKEPLFIWSFVETSVHPFVVQAKAKDIELMMQLPEDIGKDNHQKKLIKSLIVLGDRVKLSQVFRNLISNALKFTHDGGKVIVKGHWEGIETLEDRKKATSSALSFFRCRRRKTTSSSKKGNSSSSAQIKYANCNTLEAKYEAAGRVVITVSDTGVGMSKEQVKALFREGVQFTPNDLQAGQGSGLGLWITKGIVDSHDGMLLPSSDGVGRGTTFTLILPVYLPLNTSHLLEDGDELSLQEQGLIKDATSDPEDTQTPADNGALDVGKVSSIDLLLEPDSSHHQFKNLLIVDDSPVNLKMMCRSLQSVGFKCFQATDGQECVDIISKVMQNEHESIDLILMDYEMPRMNGPSACEKLRNMDCKIPIVGVTGNVLSEDKQVFMDHGAVAVLQKPFSISALQSILKQTDENDKIHAR